MDKRNLDLDQPGRSRKWSGKVLETDRKADLQAKLGPDGLIISSTGGQAGTGLIIHDKEVATVKMPVHLPDPVFVDDVRFLDTVKLRG